MLAHLRIRSQDFREFALYSTAFLAFLIAGFLGGRSLGMQVQSKFNSNFLSFASMRQDRSQYNLVVMLVDQRSASQPELEGIWLLIASSDQPVIHLVPVHAEQILLTQAADSDLHGFEMSPDLRPGREFLDQLSDRMLWDDYLVIDRSRWNSLITSLQATTNESSADTSSSDMPAAGSLHFRLDDPQQLQLQDWIVICSHLSQVSTPGQFRSFLDQLSSLSLSHRQDWRKLSRLPWGNWDEESALRCEFPTLNFEYP
jgi:hypothetical protein